MMAAPELLGDRVDHSGDGAIQVRNRAETITSSIEPRDVTHNRHGEILELARTAVASAWPS